jgi:hypothetical protein
MKSINALVIAFVLFLVAGLGNSSISLQPVFANSPDLCFRKHSAGCPGMACSNSPAFLSVHCCWTDIYNDKVVCQTCDVNTDTGEFENCSAVENKGKPDSSTVIPPPSGKAPPPSTEKCHDNSAVDKNGNCSPTTQLPYDTSDNNKHNLRGNILNDMMLSQSQDSSMYERQEQENQSNR